MKAWEPIADPVDLKHLGKLGEELGEASAIVSRCIIQGVDELDPDKGTTNRQKLQEEIADVLANISLVTDRFVLDKDFIFSRARWKRDRLRVWHAEAPVREKTVSDVIGTL